MSKFTFDFTISHLSSMIPGNTKLNMWYQALCDILPKYQIITPSRVAHFISQCAHESNNFRNLEENLNYTEDALLRVFPRYFGNPPKRNPKEFARNPEKLANYVYMDEFRTIQGRMGNTQPGDGWRFRGRGLKQLTGRNNYAAFGKTLGITAEQAADYVASEKGAIESACWFWNTNQLNTIADTRNVVEMTRRINGGDIGLADRQQRFDRAIVLLESTPKSSVNTVSETLRAGSRGNTVTAVQSKLGITADGVFGPNTEQAVRRWQTQNRITADGILTPQLISRLLG